MGGTWRVAPALADLAIERDPAAERMPWVVTDAAGRQRLRLDAVGAAVLVSLERPLGPTELHAEVEARLRAEVPPRLIARQVQHLSRSYLLAGGRSAAWRGLVADEGASVDATPRAERELVFLDGLQHECQACGACCLGTDVGPLPEELVRRLEAHDWGDRVSARADGIPLFRQAQLEGSSIWLMGSRNDACVFLRGDRLCQIHAESGAAAKPSMCRQFPYLFTQRPDGVLAVSLQLECRAYLVAKRAGTPPADQQPMLRELLAAGAFVQTMPTPLQVAPGVPVGAAEYAELEAAVIAAFDVQGPALERAARAAEVVERWVEERTADWRAEEPYLNAHRWAAVWPEAFPDLGADEEATLGRRLTTFSARLGEHLDGEAARHDEAGHGLEADRFRLTGRALRAAHGDLDVRFYSFGAGFEELLRDTWRASVFAKEPLHSGTLVDGLARIHFRLVLMRAAAALRARDALRLHVTDQDCVDSMVVVNKMGRQRSVARLLRSASEALSYLYFDNLTALSAGSVPRPASYVTGLLSS